MKKILVPCDFSTNAQSAYTFALDIAKKNNADVYVLYVIDIPFMYDAYSVEIPTYLNPEVWGQWVAEATERFQTMKKSHSRQADIIFRTERGPITTAILTFIKDQQIDLVVMGTKGTSGLMEDMIGSNTEKIVRFAKVPVLAVRRAVNLASIKNIVVPTTLDLNQTTYIAHLKELQEFFGAQLHFLVVNTPKNMKRSIDQKEQMEEFIKHYQIKGYSLNIRDGFNEEDEILGFAREKPADMIAMATHGRQGLAHLFAGSVTEHVVNHVDCPIWTFSLRK